MTSREMTPGPIQARCRRLPAWNGQRVAHQRTVGTTSRPIRVCQPCPEWRGYTRVMTARRRRPDPPSSTIPRGRTWPRSSRRRRRWRAHQATVPQRRRLCPPPRTARNCRTTTKTAMASTGGHQPCRIHGAHLSLRRRPPPLLCKRFRTPTISVTTTTTNPTIATIIMTTRTTQRARTRMDPPTPTTSLATRSTAPPPPSSPRSLSCSTTSTARPPSPARSIVSPPSCERTRDGRRCCWSCSRPRHSSRRTRIQIVLMLQNCP
mmetsp:Transcript_13314/g.32318  ORF Transcript_13314/g.32318 Transcript_13314/m.32318 type:complete len:263 (+) Transcript_13314:1402-2190(+)